MTLSFPTRRSSDLVWARTSLPVTISSRTVANVKPDDQAMARGKEAARARRGSDRAPAPAGHIADRPARDTRSGRAPAPARRKVCASKGRTLLAVARPRPQWTPGGAVRSCRPTRRWARCEADTIRRVAVDTDQK